MDPTIVQNSSKICPRIGPKKKVENQRKMGPPTFHVFLPIRGVRGVKFKIEKIKKMKKHEMQTR